MNQHKQIEHWFETKGWTPFPFQKAAWASYTAGKDGIVNAPTGSGKTYALVVPILKKFLNDQTERKGITTIWITPIRALAKEIHQSALRITSELEIPFSIAIRTGDTPWTQKQKQLKSLPDLLITTPESLHVLFASKDNARIFRNMHSIVVDEWHELMGTKRGVQVELAISRLKSLSPKLQIWGISATIGNMKESMNVLLGIDRMQVGDFIQSGIKKDLVISSVLPDQIEKMAWGGHLGIHLLEKVVPIIKSSRSTLVFTNTRSQCEIWYQRILNEAPELAGVIAMHHGSISKDLRFWVEDAIHDGRLKAVVCTSSLDLGVDFGPVESIVQIGGPKSIARFMQRAGRSGHRPGATSKIHFVPTHALELIEAAAMREAIRVNYVESRAPVLRAFDVLLQYLTTLAVGEGLDAEAVFHQVSNTLCFQSINQEEWNWLISFLTTGGDSLNAYNEFHKLVDEDGIYKVKDQRMARRHRMSIGTIVGDHMLAVKYKRGAVIGHVEEWFISKFNPGEVFWFAGRNLELIHIKDMQAIVKPSEKKSGKIPSWQGGKLSLSNRMSEMIRKKLSDISDGVIEDPEIEMIMPLMTLQHDQSLLPSEDDLLIESLHSSDGYHLFIYPFEGRYVNEGLASLIGYRISKSMPISFSIAFNDYGFELISDQPIPTEKIEDGSVFSFDDLYTDVNASINATEMAQRRFRDIAVISGMVFKGFPGHPQKEKHLFASSRLIFEVFEDYDKHNLLLRQSYEESIEYQLEYPRMRQALKKIQKQNIKLKIIAHPSPFAFPIMIDRLREKMSSESVENRISKMNIKYD